jgi:predicted TIM-barrel fold metal-dependent hydrolase
MTPIVDSHVYCFSAPDTRAGHPTVADHMALWQWGYARHHQPAFRVRDRAPGDSSVLLETAPDGTLRLAPDRSFRVDRDRERLVWTVDGEDFTKVFLPPNTLEYTAGNLIADMDYAGVDWALLHVDAALSKDVEYQAACVRAYPDRLRSMAPVDEWRIESEPDAVIAQAHEAIEVHGLHALKIIPEYAYLLAGADGFDGPAWRPFWDAVTQLDVPLFFTLGSPSGATDLRQGFLDELWTLARWADRYPDARASVTHGFNWRHHVVDDRIELSDRMWEPFRDRPNLTIEVSFAVRIGDLFDYPWTVSQPVLAAMVENIGADRLLWGTDMPFQNRFSTYRQSREAIERYSPFLDPDQVAALMGGTAARILGIPDA